MVFQEADRDSLKSEVVGKRRSVRKEEDVLVSRGGAPGQIGNDATKITRCQSPGQSRRSECDLISDWVTSK